MTPTRTATQRYDLYTVSNLQYAPEFVAAAIERQTAYRVKLVALLQWVHEQCKRIISRMKLAELAKGAAKAIMSLPLLPTPVAKPISPASQYGKQVEFKALAEKAKVAAATKGSFNRTKPNPDRPVIESVYRTKMRVAAAEAGL